MIDSQKVLYSAGANDECYTPAYGVRPILKYIPKDWVVWCPFDMEESEYVKLIRANGNKVIASHISEGRDFYCFEPKEHWDCIISNPPFCFDDKTEVLTKRGWMNYENIKNTDLILSLDYKTKQIKWDTISSINILPYKNKMLQFESKTIDICVTPYHRMLAESNGKVRLNKTKTDLITASEIKPRQHKQSRFGYKWSGINVDSIEIPETYISTGHSEIFAPAIKISMEKWLPFFGLWLADGYCRHTLNSMGKPRYTVGIKQSVIREEKIRSVLNLLPFDYKIYNEKGTDKANYEIHSKQLWEYLVQFGKSNEKFIPEVIKNLPVEKLRLFIDNYLFGDSWVDCYKESKTIVISTVSKKLSEDLQEIILKLGSVVNFHKTKSISKGKNYGYLYVCYWNENSANQMSKYPKPKEIDYNNIIWCPELTNQSVMLIRRNDKICFSGNTNKRGIFARALSFGKPFALLMALTWLNDSAPKQLFMEKDLQLLMFDKRIKFLNNGEVQNKITFSSAYYCWNFLPKQIIMEKLECK